MLAATVRPFQVLAVDNPSTVGKNLANNVSTSAGINQGNSSLTDILGRIINVVPWYRVSCAHALRGIHVDDRLW